ncbi:hypothetical protein [Oceanospirillum sanctuarii]|uniref:hypothetical protein n=1 Tax=Oceanospirillum sanctuarii TaxID=1434821 RepID=UPI000A397F4C|nr:hypothetical protein [Oceanospirillum sanctuarii]
MYNSDMPTRAELPGSKQLIRSTLIAFFTALVLLVTIILPAEYAIDPTGVGRMLGLTDMGEIKQQLEAEARLDAQLSAEAEKTEATEKVSVAPDTSPAIPDEAVSSAPAETDKETETAEKDKPEAQPESVEPQWRDEIRISLKPGQGVEYKLVMEAGAVAVFDWEGIEGPLNFDTHGNGSGQRISYEKGRGVRSASGELKAAFTGKHGWFFRNRQTSDVTLVLKTRGDYVEMKRVI